MHTCGSGTFCWQACIGLVSLLFKFDQNTALKPPKINLGLQPILEWLTWYPKKSLSTRLLRVMLQDTNSGVHTVIQWSLWGSYICFTKLVWIHLIQVYCWDYVQLVEYQTTATTGWCNSLTSWHTDWLLYCTVQGLKYMRLVASIIGCWFWEPIGCLSVAFGVAIGSNIADSLDGAYMGPFIMGVINSNIADAPCKWSLTVVFSKPGGDSLLHPEFSTYWSLDFPLLSLLMVVPMSMSTMKTSLFQHDAAIHLSSWQNPDEADVLRELHCLSHLSAL